MQLKKKNNNKPKSGSRPANQERKDIPLAVNVSNRTRMPRISSGPNNTVVLSHREYLSDMVANGDTLNVVGVPLQPGLAATFGWLSHLAQNFESYRFRKLKVEYVPVVPATQAGSIHLAVDYDAADAVPISKQAMMSFQGAVSAPLWSSMSIDCLPKDLGKMVSSRYVRGGLLAANLDVKTYDLGNLIIATSNCGAYAGQAGEVYLDYSVELSTPQYNIVDEANDNSLKITGAGVVSKAEPLGTAATVVGGLPIALNTGHGIKFHEAGDYLLNLTTSGTGITGNPTMASSSGDMVYQVLNGVIDAAATGAIHQIVVRAPSKGTTFFLQWGATAATIVGSTLRIARYLSTIA